MTYDDEVYDKLIYNFELLCEIIKQDTSGNNMKVDLSRIEKIINDKIPETLKRMHQKIFMNFIWILNLNMKNLEILFCMIS